MTMSVRSPSLFLAVCLIATIPAFAAASGTASGDEGSAVICERALRDTEPVRRNDDFIEHASLAGALREAFRAHEPVLLRASAGGAALRFHFDAPEIPAREDDDAPLHPFGIERRRSTRAPPCPHIV
ncbi:MAG: hypothetical protein LBS30_00605 [Planctomycetota bacterium]|jgi:hypothetical protein|nr:hypothetical protein [Planctomycetota bacterium]